MHINDVKNTFVYRLQELMTFIMFLWIHYSAKLYHHVSEIPIHSSSFHDYDGAKFTITMNVLICDVIVTDQTLLQVPWSPRWGSQQSLPSNCATESVWVWERNNTSLYKNYTMNQHLSSTTMSRSPDSKFWVSTGVYSFLWLCSVLERCLGAQT